MCIMKFDFCVYDIECLLTVNWSFKLLIQELDSVFHALDNHQKQGLIQIESRTINLFRSSKISLNKTLLLMIGLGMKQTVELLNK